MGFRHVVRVALIACFASSYIIAQNWISIGVKGGLPLTSPFAGRTFNSVVATIQNPFVLPPTIVSEATTISSGSRSFIIGPSLEVQLPLGLAIEADALYRQMNIDMQQSILYGPLFAASVGPAIASHTDMWEFPILAKYRFSLPFVKPYVEAGPAFRVASASLAEHMSGRGVSAGIGIEAHLGHLRIAPEVRYTHWGRDGIYNLPYHAASYSNQVEFLAGLSTAPSAMGAAPRSGSGLQRYLLFGLKGGLPFTTAFIEDEISRVTYPGGACQYFSCPATGYTVQTTTASRNYLVGPTIEVRLPRNVSIEGNALYGPVSLASSAVVLVLSSYLGQPSISPSIRTFHSWQLPVVAKYKFRMHFASPYLEAGPTFRTLSSSLEHYLSNDGVTTGAALTPSPGAFTLRQRCASSIGAMILVKPARFMPLRRTRLSFCWGYLTSSTEDRCLTRLTKAAFPSCHSNGTSSSPTSCVKFSNFVY
jgi:hypothetical protein